MPVHVNLNRSSYDSQGGATDPSRKPPSQLPEQSSQCVTIGLINNMSEAAFKATERQFVSLLDAASEGIQISLSLYVLPGILCTESSGHHAGSRYSNVETLWDTRLDGLIVTGREPMTPNLRDESYWESFTKVLEWARENTYSTVWSCLAAHGAVLHMDGIGRRKSDDKNFGVYECVRASDHRLTAGLSPHLHMPHSRWNSVAEEELMASGYSVLTRTADAGVDTFVKEENSLFVFFQGHPEYESDTLLREYRRDVGRYLRCEVNTYPLIPRGYFDLSTERSLTALREKAMSCRNEESLASVTATLEEKKIENTWHSTATRIYRNWLEYICAQKNESQGDGYEGVACPVSL
jgi:homoserine O-succinyltransferase/O-acetyltransferase